jgi:hypothetical protein
MKTTIQISQALFLKKLKESALHLTGISFELLALVFLLFACRNTNIIKPSTGDPLGEIIYDTYVVNRDSTDTWGDECLAKFDRQKLIDKVFENVYNGKLTPYDYFSGEKISPSQIRKMEQEGAFSRKEISKIQFNERWVWDDPAIQMRKEVISMTIAYEVYNNQGISRGHKPIFKLIFKD